MYATKRSASEALPCECASAKPKLCTRSRVVLITFYHEVCDIWLINKASNRDVCSEYFGRVMRLLCWLSVMVKVTAMAWRRKQRQAIVMMALAFATLWAKIDIDARFIWTALIHAAHSPEFKLKSQGRSQLHFTHQRSLFSIYFWHCFSQKFAWCFIWLQFDLNVVKFVIRMENCCWSFWS